MNWGHMFRMKSQEPTTLNIRIRGGDTAEQTHARMAGGWLLDLAAYPDRVHVVEEWVAAATAKAFAVAKSDPKESERWYAVAEELAAIVAHCATVRQARAGNATAQPTAMQRVLSGQLTRTESEAV